MDVYMPPGSRAWDESYSCNLLAQALSSARFGNGAKKSSQSRRPTPDAMAAEKDQEKIEAG
jgi:hypothetical protein